MKRNQMSSESMNEETLKNRETAGDERRSAEGSAHESEAPGEGRGGVVSDSDDQLLLDQQQRIEELEQRVEELQESNLRRAAELENVKKRVQRERAAIFEQAHAESVEQFLPVNDDLKRTLQAADSLDDERLRGVLDGIKLVADKFEEALKRYKVERIDETGVPFNVDLHDALMRKKVEDEEVESDTVLEVLESGYRIGDRTIRYAKVIVSE
ncbi:MAG: nucleotide exchange factor GrpE [Balneolaceae bacterium]